MEIWQKNALANIEAELQASGLSQLAFAQRAKISKGHFNMVLKGREPLTRQMVSAVAKSLGKETDWFYEDHAAQKSTVRKNDGGEGSSLHEAIQILNAFEKTTPPRKALALAVLMNDPKPLKGFPDLIPAFEKHYRKALGKKSRK
jgi:transcriptional regulator with XRE-family HTH domain